MIQLIHPTNSHNRATNLRQCLLRASRGVNGIIVERLHQHGFTNLRSTHTTLLSNLELEGNSLTLVAQRAGITKQAMGRLADELVKLEYITKTISKHDKRSVAIEFTPTGLELMNCSFKIMEELESHCSRRIGKHRLTNLITSLLEISDELENNYDK
jgi:DNA-binding MarR family transcriptional regulator